MKGFVNNIKKYILKFNHMLELFYIPFMGIMILIILLQVSARFIPGFSLAWTEEVSIYMMIWGAFLGGSVGLAKGKHIAITMFYNKLPKPLKRAADLVKIVIVMFYLYILIYYGYLYAQTGWEIISPATRIPAFWVFIAIPIGGLIMLLQLFLNPYLYQKEGTVEAAMEEGAERSV